MAALPPNWSSKSVKLARLTWPSRSAATGRRCAATPSRTTRPSWCTRRWAGRWRRAPSARGGAAPGGRAGGAARRPGGAGALRETAVRLPVRDGTKLKNFLEFNDDYRRQARLTLALHPQAAALWRLPWNTCTTRSSSCA